MAGLVGAASPATLCTLPTRSNPDRKAAPMAAAPRKTAPKKAPALAAAVEAVGEVDMTTPHAEADPNAPVVVPFRGVEFKIEREILGSARFLTAIAMNQPHRIVYEALGDEDSARYIALCKRGENLWTCAAEFTDALSTAAGWGNS